MLTFTCSVCKWSCPSGDESDWLLHLLQEGHQKLARKELPQWEEWVVRNHVLVIFGSLPVDRDVRIIERLSQGGWTVVTDFVWFEGRPQVGFVQFGSRDKLLKAMGSFQDHKFVIDACQACHLMDGERINWWELLTECGALMELEGPSGANIWNPVPVHPADPPRMGPSAPKKMKMKSSKSVPPPINEDRWMSRPGHSSSPEEIPRPPRGVAPLLVVNDDVDAWASTEWSSKTNHSDPWMVPQPSPGTPSSNNKDLWHHLSAIRKLIEIPDEEYRAAVDIVCRLQEAFNQSRGDGEPIITPTLSRHWIVKLKYGEGDELNQCCTLGVHKESGSIKYLYFNMKEVTNRTTTLLGKERKKYFPHYDIVESQTQDPNLVVKGGDYSILRYGFEPLRDTPASPVTQMMINIILWTRIPVETQVWHLVKHLVTFDPHCYSVLAVAYYWAKINGIRVGGGYRKASYDTMGDPSAMNWLLIYFFQADGLLPTTREVMERPHEEIIHNTKDIGFSQDTTWWKPTGRKNVAKEDVDGGGYEKFAEEVFTLLYRFFLFCDSEFGGGSNAEGGWILNTRDARRISVAEMNVTYVTLGESVTHSGLSEHERVIVQNRLRENSEPEPLTILHPFMINDWSIKASNAGKAFKAMKKTGTKLKEFLQSGDGPVKREKLEFGEFLKLLKL